MVYACMLVLSEWSTMVICTDRHYCRYYQQSWSPFATSELEYAIVNSGDEVAILWSLLYYFSSYRWSQEPQFAITLLLANQLVCLKTLGEHWHVPQYIMIEM